MYQSLLTRRYLTSKVMPLLAALAVALCTAMVLIVWSVMGGFLHVLVNTGRTLVGDVSISWPTSGFGHYQDLVKRLEADPMVEAAAPLLESYGLMRLPTGRVETVYIKGVEGASFARVTGYADALWWRPVAKPLQRDTAREDWRLLQHGVWQQLYQDGLALTERDPESGEDRPAVVPGIQVSGFNIRRVSGVFVPGMPIKSTAAGRELMQLVLPFDGSVTLNVLSFDESGRSVDTVSMVFPVANEFHSGLYEIDRRTVFVRLDALQRMLQMDAARRVVRPKASGAGGDAARASLPAPASPGSSGSSGSPGSRESRGSPESSRKSGAKQPAQPDVVIDPNTGEETFVVPTSADTQEDPARVTTVIVRGRGNVDLPAFAARCKEIYAEFALAHASDRARAVPPHDQIIVNTWEDQNATMIAAVKKETLLVLFIFSFISLTAVFLVLAIFWSMVNEKTKDVGILRSLGASRAGIATVWLAYGLAIGALGAGIGALLAYAIVGNINEIHEWLGRALKITIWDPSVYYFTRIPTDLNASKLAIVLSGGMLSSVLGALIPAIRAASFQPVRALRFE